MTIHDFPQRAAAAPAPAPADLEVTQVEQPQAGARAFKATAAGMPDVTLVVWDREIELHTPGEVWGLFVGGRQPRQVTGLEAQIGAVVFAARAHYGRALHVLPEQRGLSVVEGQILAGVGLVAA